MLSHAGLGKWGKCELLRSDYVKVMAQTPRNFISSEMYFDAIWKKLDCVFFFLARNTSWKPNDMTMYQKEGLYRTHARSVTETYC